MPEPIVDPNVDPNQDPDAKPPEGDKPPEEDENHINYWKKKYGDSENEKGKLRDQVETEKANTQFFQQQAQQNIQTAQKNQDNGEIAKLDPMEEGYTEKLLAITDNRSKQNTKEAVQEVFNQQKVSQHIEYLMNKYNMTQSAAENILKVGYASGASTPEQAKQIYGQQFGSLFGTVNQPNNNLNLIPNPNPTPTNQVKYDVVPPVIPTGGDSGSGSGLTKMPSVDEWNAMTDEEKRTHKRKVKEGKVEFNSDNSVFVKST